MIYRGFFITFVPNSSTTILISTETIMNSTDKNELKLKIKALIAKAEKEIVSMEAMTEPIKPENSLGRISRMDAINNKSVQEAALRNKKRQYSQLKLALSKIDEDSFGFCSRCKRPIQQARLILMPEKTTCVHCAR